MDYPEWNDSEYYEANSARDVDYLKNSTDYYESSLYEELQQIEPRPVLKPNRKLFESAQCHAKESGERGFVGHEIASSAVGGVNQAVSLLHFSQNALPAFSFQGMQG